MGRRGGLTKHQRERIRQSQERRREHLKRRKANDDTTGPNTPEGALTEGVVVVRNGPHFVVADEAGQLHPCLSRTHVGHVVCGDRVVWQQPQDGDGIITALLARTSVLARPDYSGRDKALAANIDRLIVVIAPEPEPTGYLIDQYMVTAEVIGIAATLAVNKIDLTGSNPDDFLSRFSHYPRIGYPLIAISAKQQHGLDPIISHLEGATAILVGQSGVGKSSLINALLPDREIQVGRLSAATGLGCHTTSTATLYSLPEGGRVIDSPGVRSFRLGNLERKRLEWGFREFRPHIGRCQFTDCRHDQEPGCAIKAAVEEGEIHPSRLASYLHMARPPQRRR